ncbi:MAG: FAD-dependent oxidoreductase [Acidobacteria bacterium]|nr:FAD-dependent oxidoreductase [Acidobacteriota bacterium]
MSEREFPHLFSPITIGSVTLQNRLVFLPHGALYAGDDGLPNERHAYYFEERARGGVGLIILESMVTNSDGGYMRLINAFDQRAIPGFRRIAERVHEHGAKVLGQLLHLGNQAVSSVTLLPMVAPSAVADPTLGEVPKEMDEDDLRRVVDGHVQSARNLKEAGFDGVELKAGHDGILRQFLSPYSNKRTDHYGGSAENRVRYILEALAAIRSEVGENFLIGVRLCMDEFLNGGYGLEEAKEFARLIEAGGQVDYFSSDLGIWSSFHMVVAPMVVPPGYANYATSALKETVEVPVISFGRINDPGQAEKILADGIADLIGMARELICDPDFANKARDGQTDDIRHCIACNQFCIARACSGFPISCIYNPAAGFEQELGGETLRKAARIKKVIVVGGGPAGLEAARVAALRGHLVTLYEKEAELGGQVLTLAKVPTRQEFGEMIRWLSRQVYKLGVRVHLCTEISKELIQREQPDVAIVATGAQPEEPSFPGGHLPHVVQVEDLLSRPLPPVKNVVVADCGAGTMRCWSTALYLAEQGMQVTIVTPLGQVGQDLDPPNFLALYPALMKYGVTCYTQSKLTAVESEAVVIANLFSEREIRLERVDLVVLTWFRRSRNELVRELKGCVPGLYAVGDCVAPRNAGLAVREAHLVARSL